MNFHSIRIWKGVAVLLIACVCNMHLLHGQTLYGQFKNQDLNNQWIYFSALEGNLAEKIDSVRFSPEGRFEFSNKNYPEGYYRISLENGKFYDVIMSPREERVIVSFQSENLLDSAVVEESVENQAQLIWKRKRQEILTNISEHQQLQYSTPKDDYKQQRILEASIDSFWVYEQEYLNYMLDTYPNTFFSTGNKGYGLKEFQQYLRADQESKDVRNIESIRTHFFDNIDWSNNAFIRSPVLKDMVWKYLNNYVQRDAVPFYRAIDKIMDKAAVNPDMWDYCLRFLIESLHRTGPKIIFQYVVEEYLLAGSCVDELALDDGVKLMASIYEQLQTGNSAVDATITDVPSSKSINLRDVSAKNQQTLLFFWSSHCHFCNADTPGLKEVYAEYKDKGLQIIGISTDTDEPAYLQALREKAMPWDNFTDFQGWSSPIVDTYKVHKTPYYYLISNDFTISGKPARLPALRKSLRQLFDE